MPVAHSLQTPGWGCCGGWQVCKPGSKPIGALPFALAYALASAVRVIPWLMAPPPWAPLRSDSTRSVLKQQGDDLLPPPPPGSLVGVQTEAVDWFTAGRVPFQNHPIWSVL